MPVHNQSSTTEIHNSPRIYSGGEDYSVKNSVAEDIELASRMRLLWRQEVTCGVCIEPQNMGLQCILHCVNMSLYKRQIMYLCENNLLNKMHSNVNHHKRSTSICGKKNGVQFYHLQLIANSSNSPDVNASSIHIHLIRTACTFLVGLSCHHLWWHVHWAKRSGGERWSMLK